MGVIICNIVVNKTYRKYRKIFCCLAICFVLLCGHIGKYIFVGFRSFWMLKLTFGSKKVVTRNL